MFKSIRKILLSSPRLAEYYESRGELSEAFKIYQQIGNYVKVGEILGKTGKWHEAANLYISKNEVDLARRAIEKCFIQGHAWEVYELEDGKTISIEEWLKRKRQVQRFVRYNKSREGMNEKGIPLIVVLADKLQQVREYKSAAELFRNAFTLINKDRSADEITKTVWLRYSAQCFAKAGLYAEAAATIKELILTEVNIGESLFKADVNPKRNYSENLKLARECDVLPLLIDAVGDTDPFNFAYDLLKIGEPELSEKVFFKFYGRILHRKLNDAELELRNKKIHYCLNQYVIYYRSRKEYTKAAEIALMDSQKEIASDLFKKAAHEQERYETSSFDAGDIKNDVRKTLEQETKQTDADEPVPKCAVCGQVVDPGWEICPSCGNVLYLGMCVCGSKIKPEWDKCPDCQRTLKKPTGGKTTPPEDIGLDSDTKPFKTYKRDH
jgi:hypothetical protein